MLVFLCTFVLTNIIFASIIYNILFEINKSYIVLRNELFLHSLGLAPALTALILYYSFLIIPHRSNQEYFFFIILCYLVLLFLSLILSYKNTNKNKKVKIWFRSRFSPFILLYNLAPFILNHTAQKGARPLLAGHGEHPVPVGRGRVCRKPGAPIQVDLRRVVLGP